MYVCSVHFISLQITSLGSYIRTRTRERESMIFRILILVNQFTVWLMNYEIKKNEKWCLYSLFMIVSERNSRTLICSFTHSPSRTPPFSCSPRCLPLSRPLHVFSVFILLYCWLHIDVFVLVSVIVFWLTRYRLMCTHIHQLMCLNTFTKPYKRFCVCLSVCMHVCNAYLPIRSMATGQYRMLLYAFGVSFRHNIIVVAIDVPS